MNLAVSVVSIVLAVVFFCSAAVKGTQSKARMLQIGMTGVVDAPLPVMRLTAVAEILGVLGLFFPYATDVAPILTPLAAIGLGIIMVLAARIHLGLGEPKTALGNMVLLAMCLLVAVERWPG